MLKKIKIVSKMNSWVLVYECATKFLKVQKGGIKMADKNGKNSIPLIKFPACGYF